MKKLLSITIAALILCAGISPLIAQETALAENPSAEEKDMHQVGEVLIVFLVLSAVFEVALTPIFNWRLFLAHFEGKGYKTPITVILAFIVFWGYDLDIVKDLLVALDYPAKLSLGGQLLTALLIAGGSDGVFRIFAKIGIRDPDKRKEKTEEVRAKMAEERKDTA